MSGLSVDFRLPVSCASCRQYVCLYHDACTLRRQGMGSESEALIEKAANRGRH